MLITIHYTFNYDACSRVLSKKADRQALLLIPTTTMPPPENVMIILPPLQVLQAIQKRYQYDNLQRLISGKHSSTRDKRLPKVWCMMAWVIWLTQLTPPGITINDAYDVNGILTQTSMTYGGATQTLFTGNANEQPGRLHIV
ncbi:MAG: hypothetical protein WKF59_11460 [Chitinophagaceae bacterium]